MEKEPKRYTRKEIRRHQTIAGTLLATLGLSGIVIASSFLPKSELPGQRTAPTFRAAPKLPEASEESVPSNIEVKGVEWTQKQREEGAVEVIASGNTRYITGIFPAKSPVNAIDPSAVVITLENRFEFNINPENSITTIGKDGSNTTFSVEYPENNYNFDTTSRILNEPTIIVVENSETGEVSNFAVNPNA